MEKGDLSRGYCTVLARSAGGLGWGGEDGGWWKGSGLGSVLNVAFKGLADR